jgi:hypothetical protein
MWQPIEKREFEELVENQQNAMDAESQQAFEFFRVPIYSALIRRSKMAGDEKVFVIANSPKGAIYFDDVEYGFNFSPIGEDGRILEPGGSQASLADAVEQWLLPQLRTEKP